MIHPFRPDSAQHGIIGAEGLGGERRRRHDAERDSSEGQSHVFACMSG
jgi:hypothetical protein